MVDPQPMSPCLAARHTIFRCYLQVNLIKCIISGRNTTNRQTKTKLDFLKSDNIGSQKFFDFSHASRMVSPQNGECSMKGTCPPHLKTAALNRPIIIYVNSAHKNHRGTGPFDSHQRTIHLSVMVMSGLHCSGLVQANDFVFCKRMIHLSVNLLSG